MSSWFTYRLQHLCKPIFAQMAVEVKVRWRMLLGKYPEAIIDTMLHTMEGKDM